MQVPVWRDDGALMFELAAEIKGKMQASSGAQVLLCELRAQGMGGERAEGSALVRLMVVKRRNGDGSPSIMRCWCVGMVLYFKCRWWRGARLCRVEDWWHQRNPR
jgi:hypothetical protein